MSQRISQKPVVQFNRGLVTEAGELTFPEGASVDELNMTLERTGSRRRRLGVQYEIDGTTVAGTSATVGAPTSVGLWRNAGAVAGLNFVVVQLGAIMHFFTEDGGAISEAKRPFTVNLQTYARPNGFGASTVPVQVTSIQGRLVVASSEVDTFEITYNDANDTISASEIKFRIRDFEWQGDRSTYSSAASSPTKGRKYDTANTGWSGTKGTAALTAFGSHPPLTLPWYAGKDADGNFSKAEWEKIFVGSSLIANGTYIYDIYNINRSSKIAGATNYVETSRFKAVATFAGRVFYTGMSNKNTSNIFFSRLIQQDEDLGECFQVNDPTSEEFSDLLDTDGGVISIPDAYNIQRLHILGSQLLVFAENGVWSIKGIDGVFRASSFSINKIGDAGLEYAGSFVAEEGGRPYWWSASGIHTFAVSKEQQTLTVNNVSLTTIQAFYDGIDANKRAQVKAAYDSFNKRVGWFFPKNTTSAEGKLDRVLWLDETLPAFYPWEIADGDTNQYILAPFFIEGNATTAVEFNVVDSNGDLVVTSSGDSVVVKQLGREYNSSALMVLVRDASGQIAFAQFTDATFKDWGKESYSSFVEGGYDFVGDMTTKKNVLYVVPYCEVTEQGFLDEGDGSYNFIRPSSCLATVYWDFSTSPTSKEQEIYRLKKLPVPDGTGVFKYPETVTTSRIRMRGRGRSLRMRFESTEGNDFHLIGYDLISGKNTRI